MPATVEELQGLIAGLSEVVKGLATNLNTVATQVGAITAASHGQQSSETDPVVTQNPNLRLPTLQLPTFRQDTTVQDDISYFLERFQEQTAHLTPPVRQALLEQQCIGEWPRSVLSFCRSTEGFTAQTPSQQFDMYVKALREEFEEPKDSKCRRLASELSAMVQDPSESIDQFAFKYKNVLHKLDKLGENLSKACPTYVTSQFISKLQPHIAQHIVLQADQITRLDKAIEAARRIEQSFSAKTPASQSLTSTSPGSTSTSTLADWKPSRSALVTTPTRFNSPRGSHQQQQNSCWICGDTNHISRDCTKRTKRPTKKTPEVCLNFNKFISAHCEQANNKCSAGRLHKCSNCNKWGCKAVRHKETPPQSLVAGLQSTDKPSDETAPVGQDTAVFGLPAVTNPAGSLKERHILWTPVISAGEKLPLPLDSCYSVSLVSRFHADLVASKCPKLKYQSLENPIAVSVADSQSQLKAIGTMEIPIQWNNGKESTFQMLVVPGLSWPVLFGENHLHATQALVDHAEPSIHFRHPSMSFQIACSLQNPLTEAHGCSSNTHAGVTCLLTGPSFPGYSPGYSQLNRGLNFVSVCLTVGTALMAFSPSDLWVDGQDIQPGVKVLSGSFHMTAATDQLVPGKSCHASVVNIPETSCESSFVQHISDPQSVYTTTLAIECKRKQADIPQNIILGHLRPMQKEDTQVYEDAAENTASVLAESWMSWANGQQVLPPSSAMQPSSNISSTQTWRFSEQQKELATAGLDSSVLSPFSENISELNEHDKEFVPPTTTPLDPFSDEYYQALLTALAVNSPKYAHVDPDTLQEFKQLLRKYPHCISSSWLSTG